jgi:hypothetical protein
MFWWDDDDFVTVEEAAQRMALAVAEVRAMTRDRILRSRRVWGGLMVQPAIVRGCRG